MRGFVLIIVLAVVASAAVAGYATPGAKDDYDEDAYSKGALVNYAASRLANQQKGSTGDLQSTYPLPPPPPPQSTQTTTTTATMSYGPDRTKFAKKTLNAYQPQPAQNYAPVSPQRYSNNINNINNNNNNNNNNDINNNINNNNNDAAADDNNDNDVNDHDGNEDDNVVNNKNQAAVKSERRPQQNYGPTPRSSARILAGYGPNLIEVTQPHEPHSFSYTAEDEDGLHSHRASSDSQGRVSGEYTIQLADGRNRVVKYTADERGYRADIVTNELGTESKNPADVTIQSSAITGEQAAFQFGQRYQRQSANYRVKEAVRSNQVAYAPPAAGRLAAVGRSDAAGQQAAQRAGQRAGQQAGQRAAPTGYVPASSTSSRPGTTTTEPTFQLDHNAGFNDATATVEQVPFQPVVEQVLQRTDNNGPRRRNKPSYG